MRKRAHLSTFIDGIGLFRRYHDALNLFRSVFGLYVWTEGQQTCVGNSPVHRTLAGGKRETLTHAA